MKKNKEQVLLYLEQKLSGEIKRTYAEIKNQTGYSKRHLMRLYLDLQKKDIDSLKVHGLQDKPSNNSASTKEREYIKNFKKKYPEISITQFRDIYVEDILNNIDLKDDIENNKLQNRSLTFFCDLFQNEGWKSTIKHKKFKSTKEVHSLRDPVPRKGILVMTDGTPHDWFKTGEKYSLHITLDDADGTLISGWFMKNECTLGYCHSFKIMLEKYGIPQMIYSDKTSILYTSKDANQTQVERMLNELGIELIYANSPEAKGKVEKMNNTIQNRIINDIKRFSITTYDELNIWFNDYYIDYLNNKFGYIPQEKESEFVKIKTKDINNVFCFKEKRKILSGNLISYKNNYYEPIDKSKNSYAIYKGSTVEVRENIFTKEIKIWFNKKLIDVRKVEGHRFDSEKKKNKEIENQKILERLIRERDERLKKFDK